MELIDDYNSFNKSLSKSIVKVFEDVTSDLAIPKALRIWHCNNVKSFVIVRKNQIMYEDTYEHNESISTLEYFDERGINKRYLIEFEHETTSQLFTEIANFIILFFKIRPNLELYNSVLDAIEAENHGKKES